LKFTIEIPDEEIYKIGKELIKDKLKEYLEFISLEKDLEKLSTEIRKEFTEGKYWQEIERIREEAWEEYKKDLELE